MFSKSQTLPRIFGIIFLITFSQSMILELSPQHPETCFFIRGELTDDEFTCYYSVSGDGNQNLETTVKTASNLVFGVNK